MSKDKSKALKESFFVQVEGQDKTTPHFVDVTRDLGKVMPFTKPLATVGMRVTDDAVMFSAMKLQTKSRGKVTAAAMSLPAGPLARLERKKDRLPTPPVAGEILVELDEEWHTILIKTAENGVATLEGKPDEADVVFELPVRPLSLTIAMNGPKGRVLLISWSGFQNKPGAPETLVRAVAYTLNHMCGLAAFSLLTGIQKVQVPAPPGRFTAARPARKAADEINFPVPVRLWTEEVPARQVAAGAVKVHIDLDVANPATGRFMFNLVPSKELEDEFSRYSQVMQNALQNTIGGFLGPDEVTDILCDITLGEVGAGTMERLRDAAGMVTGYDLNPKQFVPFAAAAN